MTVSLILTPEAIPDPFKIVSKVKTDKKFIIALLSSVVNDGVQSHQTLVMTEVEPENRLSFDIMTKLFDPCLSNAAIA